MTPDCARESGKFGVNDSRLPRLGVKIAGACLAAVCALAPARVALALDTRAAKFAWDSNGILRGAFSYRDALDNPAIAKKLNDGLVVTVVMRGYVYRQGSDDPVALTVHTCRVAYQLWQEVYSVAVNGVAQPPKLRQGLYRVCTDMVDFPIVERSILQGDPREYFLAVKIEVNPVSAAILKKVQSWVTRPSGATGAITPGDALFASFVGVFMRKIATADLAMEFRTPAFPS